MPTSSMLKAKGLQTFANFLSAVPEGALLEAENVIIDRDGIIEPRRGIKVNGTLPEQAEQLLVYKNRILAHYDNSLAFSDGNDPATFTPYKKRSDFQITDVSINPVNTIKIVVHGLAEDSPIVFTTTGTLPAPLVSGTTYYVTNPTQNTFQVSATPGSSAIPLTTTGTGLHTATYNFVVISPDSDARIKGIELNGNFYITDTTGIKKIAGLNADYMTDSGVPAALDMRAVLDLTSIDGFLGPLNEVNYRHTWAYTDINGNFIEGTASYSVNVFNPDTSISKNVKLSFPIPAGITTDYSYRIYRSAQTTGTAGDEEKLVADTQVTAAQILAGSVDNVIDNQDESLQSNGTPLYSNQFSGEGASQTNDRPPIAKDIAVYKNIAFFANTTTNHKFNFELLGQDGLTSFTNSEIASVVFSAGYTTFTVTGGHGMVVNQDVVLLGTTVSGKDGTWPAILDTGSPTTKFKLLGDFSTINLTKSQLFTSYITISKSGNDNKYYFVGSVEKSKITVASNGAGAAGAAFSLYSADNAIAYYVWLNDTGATTTDPAPAGKIGIKVDYVATDTTAQIATKVANKLNTTADFAGGTIGSDIYINNTESGPATDISTYTPAVFSTPVARSKGFGEDVTKNYVRLSSLTSPFLKIESTARSLVYVINQNENDSVNAFYTSQSSELSGIMQLVSKVTDTTAFTLLACSSHDPTDSTVTTGSMFTPSLATSQSSQNESFPNKIYFSKVSQPEAVPISNSLLIGPKDKKILRILGLRDSLFILKEEGIYRLTGESTATFSVSLFDNSANLTAPDTAAILNNQIYALTSQGVATVSESGVGIISRPIENLLNRTTSPDYSSYISKSFAFGYEADRAYLLFTIDKSDDETATKCFRYNTFTQCWTKWKKSATCGIVETNANKIYLGAADINAVEVERKAITSRDYVDREYTRQFISYDAGIVVDDSSNIQIGDSIEQTQYLSPFTYNQLVRKAKMDGFLTFSSSFPEITTIGTSLRTVEQSLVEQLNTADGSLYTGTFNGATNVNTGTDTITITGHTLIDGDVIQLTGGTMPTPLVASTNYYVVNSALNTIQLSNTLDGTVINITAVGSGTITIKELYLFTDTEDFATHQSDFNYNINKLNASSGAFFVDYKLSVGTTLPNSLVTSVGFISKKLTLLNYPVFFQGPVTHYKSIRTNIIWAPIALGEPSILKHIRRGTFLLESDVIIGATIGHASDLSGNFEDQNVGLGEDGEWGEGTFGEITWGGEGTSVPMSVLIPRQKQRCRYIKARFKHNNAFNKFSILGISYTFEMGSERAYR